MMKKQNLNFSRILFTVVFGVLFLLNGNVNGQTIMFDDFTYTGVNDPQLPVFNKWDIINGTSGPPEGAQYSRNNINFITDPANASNKLMTLSTTVNGSTKATTHSRIETSDYSYFEGTYAARVYFTDNPFTYKDANIQTFYTIVGSNLSGDGSKYSELDFEYMASDKWGIAADKQVMYMTSWNRYIADPWQAWKRYFSSQKSWEGWHTCVVSCTDKVNVKWWIDGVYFGSMAVTDNDGTSVYPRSNMQIAFANWIWNNVTGSSTANRTTTMQADWVLYYKNQEISPTQVNDLVASYRSQGLQRRNLAGQTYVTGTTNQAPQVQLTAPANNSNFTAPASINITANATDADGTVSKVEFFNGATSLGTDATSPYSFNWTNVSAGTYTITAKATDNLNAVTTSSAVTVVVKPAVVPQSPYGGSIWQIPGTIEAENYDLGGQDVAYNETTTANEGGAYRTTEPVDIEPTTGGGYNVGYITAGEWLEYSVNVNSAGNYNIDARVAATAAGKSFRLELDGTTIGTFSVPNTTGWQTWQTITLNNVALNVGQKVLRFYAITADFNLDKVVFSKTNQLPSVSITSPSNNATFTAPASITINADASDADGSVSKVEFFNGTTSLGSDASSPYSFVWNNVAAGTYVITAKATDNTGGVTTSSVINIIVNTSTNKLPVVSITSPSNNATFIAPATVAITANATDSDGSISKVEFYNGSALLGASTTTPYSFNWTNVQTGTYTITARAIDNVGGIAISSAINIVVNTRVNQLPTVSIVSPSNNSTFNEPAIITINATASDVDGTISKIEFYNGTVLLGTDVTSPYSYAWTNVAAGSYNISAKAIDNDGAGVLSSQINLTVKPVTGNPCTGIAQYRENDGYVAGSKVQNAGSQYQCKPWPYSGWCNGAAWAYAPGTGSYWTDAWTFVGSCNSGARSSYAVTNEALIANVPNPFVGNTNIQVQVETSGNVSVKIYDQSGVLVGNVFDGHLTTGTYYYEFDGTHLKPGMYYIHCIMNDRTTSKKIVKAE